MGYTMINFDEKLAAILFSRLLKDFPDSVSLEFNKATYYLRIDALRLKIDYYEFERLFRIMKDETLYRDE